MPQMRRVEFPKIDLTLTKVDDSGRPVLDDKDCPARPHTPGLGNPPPLCLCKLIREPTKAQKLHEMALAEAGTASGYKGLRLHLPISAAIEKAKGDHILLDEAQWAADTAALEAFKNWPWYHNDVLRVIDAAKNAEKVEVKATEEKPNRRQRRAEK